MIKLSVFFSRHHSVSKLQPPASSHLYLESEYRPDFIRECPFFGVVEFPPSEPPTCAFLCHPCHWSTPGVHATGPFKVESYAIPTFMKGVPLVFSIGIACLSAVPQATTTLRFMCPRPNDRFLAGPLLTRSPRMFFTRVSHRPLYGLFTAAWSPLDVQQNSTLSSCFFLRVFFSDPFSPRLVPRPLLFTIQPVVFLLVLFIKPARSLGREVLFLPPIAVLYGDTVLAQILPLPPRPPT